MTTFKENRGNGLFGIALRVLNSTQSDSQETPEDAGGLLYYSHMRWVFNDGSILSDEVWNRYCK